MTGTGVVRGLRIAAVVLGASLFGCSGGSDSSPPPADMSGNWLFYMTPPGGGAESGPEAVLITQNGASLNGAGMTGSISGNNFTMTADAVIFTLVLRGTVQGDSGSGTLEIQGLTGLTGSFRLQRFTPTGTLTANGSMQGRTVAVDTTTAAGARVFLDPGMTMLDQVEFVAMMPDSQFEIAIDASGVAVGTLAVPGDVAVNVLYRGDAFSIEVQALGGSIEVLQYDASGFSGTFNLDLPAGDNVTGSFQVSFDFDAYDG